MASPQVSLPPLAAADGPATDVSKDGGSPPGSPTAIDAPSAGLAWADPDIYGRGYDGLFGERAERKTARAAGRKLLRQARARAAAADPTAAATEAAAAAAAANATAAAAAAATDGSPEAVVPWVRLPARREHVDHDLYGRGDPRLFGVDAHLETAAGAGAALAAAQDAKVADAAVAARSPTATGSGIAAAAASTAGGTGVLAASPVSWTAGSPRSRLFFRSASPALLGKAKARIKAKMSARPLPRGAGSGKAAAGSWRTAVPGGSRTSSDGVPAHGLARINASVANAARSPSAAGANGLAGGGTGATTAPLLTPGSAVAGLAARWEQGAAAREADDLPSVTAKDTGAGIGGIGGIGGGASSARGRRPGAFTGAAAGSAAGGGVAQAAGAAAAASSVNTFSPAVTPSSLTAAEGRSYVPPFVDVRRDANAAAAGVAAREADQEEAALAGASGRGGVPASAVAGGAAVAAAAGVAGLTTAPASRSADGEEVDAGPAADVDGLVAGSDGRASASSSSAASSSDQEEHADVEEDSDASASVELSDSSSASVSASSEDERAAVAEDNDDGESVSGASSGSSSSAASEAGELSGSEASASIASGIEPEGAPMAVAAAVSPTEDALGSEVNSSLSDESSSSAAAAEYEDEEEAYEDAAVGSGDAYFADNADTRAAGEGADAEADTVADDSSAATSSSEVESDSEMASSNEEEDSDASEEPFAADAAESDSDADSGVLNADLSSSDAADSDEESEISEGASAQADVAALL